MHQRVPTNSGRQAYPGLKRFRLGSPAWVKKFVDWETDITPGAWPFSHFACSVTSPQWPPVSDVPSVASWLSSHDTLHHLVSLWEKQSAPQNRQATPSICFLEILPKGVGEREFNIPTFHFAVRIHLYYFDIPPILGHIGVQDDDGSSRLWTNPYPAFLSPRKDKKTKNTNKKCENAKTQTSMIW